MKRLLAPILGLGTMLLILGTSHAAPIQTDNLWSKYVPPSYEYVFSGFYNPKSEEIDSAKLEVAMFSLYDNALAHVLLDGELVSSAPVQGN